MSARPFARIFPRYKLVFSVLIGLASCRCLTAQLADLISRRQLSIDGDVQADVLLLDKDGELTVADNAHLKGDVRLPTNGKLPGDGRGIAASVKKNISSRAGTFAGDLRESDGFVFPKISGPKPPRGTRTVRIKGGEKASFDDARDITMENADASLAPGQYGALTVDNSQLILGFAGAEHASRYDFTTIDLLRRGQITLAGPVIITVDHLGALNGGIGRDDLPGWLDLRVAHGPVEVPAQGAVYGSLYAASSEVTLKNGATIEGWLAADTVVVSQNGRFRSRKVDWDPASHPSRHPTFAQRAVLLESRLARFKELVAGHYTLSVAYDSDVPTVTLVESAERQGEKITAKDLSIFFDTFSLLLAGSFVDEARLVMRKSPGRSLSGHQVVDVSMTRRSFEDHLWALCQNPNPAECLRQVQGSVGLQNIFLLWCLGGAPAEEAR